MDSETTAERISAYENNLRRCPPLCEAAERTRGVPADAADRFLAGLAGKAPDGAKEVLTADCDLVISPALHAYVLWVLRQASEQGIKRLYFLARDGYLLYGAAVRICEALSLPIECRYFYCSRYSVRIPMFHMDTEEALEYICRGGLDVTLTKVLNRAGLAEAEQARVVEELKNTPFGQKLIGDPKDEAAAGGFAETAAGFAGLPIPYAMLAQLRDALRENRYFIECMTRHSEESLPALEGYFRQEGLSDEIPMAVVDSGWTGSMQKVMNRLLAALGKKKDFLTGYYWGLYELPADVDPAEYHCYYFAPDTNLKEKVYFSNNLFEEVCGAPHGITLGFEKRSGAFGPVLCEAEETHRIFLEMISERMRVFTENLLGVLAKRQAGSAQERLACEHDREAVRAQFALFMGNPTRAEAGLFGRLSFSDDVLEYGGQLAAAMTDKELTDNHAARKVLSLIGATGAPLTESAWYEASAVLNGHRVRRHIRGYKRYKQLLYRNKARIYRRQVGDGE